MIYILLIRYNFYIQIADNNPTNIYTDLLKCVIT